MKKTRFVAFLCAIVMILGSLQGTVAVAAEDVAQETAEYEMLFDTPVYANSLQDGYLYSTPVYTYDEELPVVQAGESWRAGLKARLATAIRNYDLQVDVSDLAIPCTDDIYRVLGDVLREVIDENPNFFYVAYIDDVYYWINSNTVKDFMIVYDDGFTYGNGNVDQAKVNVYNTALAKALSHVKSGMSTVEKMLVLHDYLVINCEYDYENYLKNTLDDVVFSAYGALVNRSAVCQGYALAYADMMRHIGVKCYVLASKTHAWNLVYVDGNWYHIDSTWADPVGGTYDDYDTEGLVNHRFFLVSDAELKTLDSDVDHAVWEDIYSGYSAPAASHSGSYANYIFRDEALYSPLTYYNGEWYYIPNGYSGYYTGYIKKSKIDGSGASTLNSLGYANYAQVEGDYLYYSRCENMYTDGIYAVKLGGALSPERIMTMVGSKGYRDYIVDEFAVHDNIVNFVMYNKNDTSKWVRLGYYTNRRETAKMPTLVIDSAKLNYPNGIGSLDRAALPVKLVYGDGTKIDIAHSASDIAVTSDASGIYTIYTEWRGMSAQQKVSANSAWSIEDMLSVDSNWMYTAAKYAYDNGYMGGTSNTTFEPNKKMERSMFAQILYSMEGKPSVTFVDNFEDVPESGWFSSAVTWAYDNGIISGYNEDTFGTYDPVTRQQLALMLKGYAESLGIDTSARTDVSIFSDASKISNYALEAIQWAVAEGVMAGSGEKLNPLGNATRAEGAAMIRSFCENVKNQE